MSVELVALARIIPEVNPFVVHRVIGTRAIGLDESRRTDSSLTMRKDYVVVSEESQGGDETDFVARYWTGIWEESLARNSLMQDVGKREEFRIMRKHLWRLSPGAQILDAGCGLGAWTVKLASLGFDVTGLDLSQDTIGRLSALFPNRKFVVGDIRQTGFDNASFDACFSWGAFEHFEIGLGPCLAEVFRILKKGGYLFVSVPFHNGRLWRRDKLRLEVTDADFDGRRGYRKAVRFYQWRLTAQELRRECELVGFQVVDIRLLHKKVGVHRLLATDLKLKMPERVEWILEAVLGLVLSATYIAHMVMALARKR